LPHQLIERFGRRVARLTALALGGTQGIRLAPTDIVAVARVTTPSHATQLTLTTTDQASQQVLVLRVVAWCQLPIECQSRLGLVELLLTDDSGHGNGYPFLLGPGPLALPRSDGQQSRLALSGRDGARAIGVGRAGVSGVLQDAPDGGHVPALTTPGRRNPIVGQAFGYGIQAQPLFRVGIPGKDLADDSGLYVVHSQPGRVAGALHIQNVAVGSLGPGQELSSAQFAQPTTTHSVGNQGAFVFGHGPSNLQDELVVRIITHRTVQELNVTTVPFQFLQDQDLMNILACQAVGSRDQHQLELGHRCPVTQTVQARTVQLGSAVAFIPKDMLFRKMPTLSCNVGQQTFQLLFNSLRLLLTQGRNTNVDGDIHLPSPPVKVRVAGSPQAHSLLHRPIAERTGKRDPNDVVRPAVQRLTVGLSTFVS